VYHVQRNALGIRRAVWRYRSYSVRVSSVMGGYRMGGVMTIKQRAASLLSAILLTTPLVAMALLDIADVWMRLGAHSQ